MSSNDLLVDLCETDWSKLLNMTTRSGLIKELVIVIDSDPITRRTKVFHCQSCQELTYDNFTSDIGEWFLYDGKFERVIVPLKTVVYEMYGQTRIEIETPAICLAPTPLFPDIKHNFERFLFSPIVGRIAVGFEHKMIPGELYDVKAVYIPTSSVFFRFIRYVDRAHFMTYKNGITRIEDICDHHYVNMMDYVELRIEHADGNGVAIATHSSMPSKTLAYVKSKGLSMGSKIKVLLFPIRLDPELKVYIAIEAMKDPGRFAVYVSPDPHHNLVISHDINRLEERIKELNKPENDENIRNTAKNGTVYDDDFPDLNVNNKSSPPHKSDWDVVKKKVKLTTSLSAKGSISLPPMILDFDHIRRDEVLCGLVVSVDTNQKLFYIYCPELPNELSLINVTGNLALCSWVDFRIVQDPRRRALNGDFIRISKQVRYPVIPLKMKNSVTVKCDVQVPTDFDEKTNMLVTTNFVPRVIGHGIRNCHRGKKLPQMMIVRTKGTGQEDIYKNVFWVINRSFA